MLVGELGGDEAAPVYVLRLWAHCQNRRQWQFEGVSAEALKSLCRFPGHSNKLEASLLTSGFIRRDVSLLIVCNWDEYNSSLIAAWENGKRGGRPPNKPLGSSDKTQTKPTGSRLEKRRVDKTDEENTKKPSAIFVPPELNEVAQYCAERNNHVDAQNFIDFYTSKGWVVGKTKMIDWKASVRTWEKNQNANATAGRSGQSSKFESNIGQISEWLGDDETGLREGDSPSVCLETDD